MEQTHSPLSIKRADSQIIEEQVYGKGPKKCLQLILVAPLTFLTVIFMELMLMVMMNRRKRRAIRTRSKSANRKNVRGGYRCNSWFV